MKRSNYAGSGLALFIAGSLLLIAGAGRLASQSLSLRQKALPAAVAAIPQSVPEEITLLVHRATVAANTRRPAELAPFAVGDAGRDFAWVRNTTSTWAGGVLVPPGTNPPAYLAVFHAWHTCESDGDHVHTLVHTPDGWRLGHEIPETDPAGFRVRDHDLNVTLNLPQQSAAIADRVKIERTADTVPPFALLRLSQDFTVRQMTQDGPDGSAIPFRQVGGIIAFTPPAAKTFTLWMRYAGVVNHHGSDYIHTNEATLDSYWYPHIARLPATATVTATVPTGWTAIATGDRVQEHKAANGAVTITYRNDLPISFYTLDAGAYTISSRSVKGRTLSTWLLTPNPALSRSCLDLLASALEFYDTHFAPFPFTHYTIVETQGPFDGALEAYSFATFGPGTLPSVIPHELSHTWWGGLVPCPYTRSMWDESFADYSDDLFRRMTQKTLEADTNTRLDQGDEGLLRGSFVDACNAYAMDEAFDTSNPQQAAVGYDKGQRVLRVLEEQIGQETMLRAIAAFVADHKRGEAAEWPEFERAVNKVTGQDYRWFFTEWVDRPGLPVLTLSHVHAIYGNAGTQIEADVVQEGTPYRLQLSVTCTERNGESVSHALDLDAEPSGHFTLRVPGDPARLILDPNAVLPLEAPSQTPSGNEPLIYDFSKSLGLAHPLSPSLIRSLRSQGGGTKLHSCASAYSPEQPRKACSHFQEGSPSLARTRFYVRATREGDRGWADGTSLTAFLHRAEQIVNAGDKDAFAKLADSGIDLNTEWLGSRSVLGADDPSSTSHWRALPLELPASDSGPSATLAVFTRYHPVESQGDHVFSLAQTAGGWRLGHEYAEADPIGVRVRSHEVRLTLDPQAGTLRADDKMALEPDKVPAPLPASGVFLLRLEDGYTVDSMTSAGQPLAFRQAGGVVAVQIPPGPLAGDSPSPDTRVTLEITYHGKAAQGSTDFITPKEAMLSGYWLPQIGRLPVTVEAAVTVPRGWAVFTQGVPTQKAVSGDGRSVTVTYANTLPISYPSLAAGPYRVLTAAPEGGMPFGVSVAYLHSADLPMAQQALQTAQAALRFYTTHFSPYPFPRYTVVISDRFGLALEGYSMTTIARNYGPQVLPHEISHTWWGGIVPNTYLRDLWNESFAEYSDGLYERLTGRRDGMHLQETEAVRLSGMLAVGKDSLRQAHDALDMQQGLAGYMRGSLMLEALEQMIGQKAMLAGMQALIARHAPYQADTWDDFVAAVTATAGSMWQGFFDAWLPSTGLPDLRLSHVRVLRVPSGQEVEAEVAQQPGARFWLRVPVELLLKRGRARQDVMLTSASAPVHFYFSSAAKPVVLEIDPQKTLLRAYPPQGDTRATVPTTYRFPAAPRGGP